MIEFIKLSNMTPGWGRKRCSRRPCPPPLCVAMPRPCLDSLQIPTLQPRCVPRCVQPSCGIKRRICHCADNNYCTAETCANATSCIQSQNLSSSDYFKGDKDKDSVCKGPCRQEEGRERNYVEDYKIVEPSCNEASCENLENCGVGSISNDEDLIHPVPYTPSVTNQNSLSKTPTIVPSRQVPFNNDSSIKNNHNYSPSSSIIGVTGKGMTPKSYNFDEVNKLSNLNKSIQINMQNETVSGRRRDAESSVAPEVCCRGNEVVNSFSLLEPSEYKLYNEDKSSGPVQNIKPSFDAAIDKYDTNAQSYSQSSKTSESQLNTHDSNVGDKSDKFRDNAILPTEEHNNNANKPALNSYCNHSYNLPASLEPKFNEQLNDTENAEFRDDYHRIKKNSQTNVKLCSELCENRAKRNYINGSSMQSDPLRSPGTNRDCLYTRDNTEYIMAKGNVLPNYAPSSIKTIPYVNGSTSNELAKISLSGNNTTNERGLFKEGMNQFKGSVPNEFCISETPQGYLGSSDPTSPKPPQFISPSPSINIQPIIPYTKLLTNNTSQVKVRDNNHINNAIYPSPIENQNKKNNLLPRSSDMQINVNNSRKEINYKIQPTNSATSDQTNVTCEECKQDCGTHDACETAKKRKLANYKPSYLGCVCPDEVESLTEAKHKQKNTQKFASYDLKDIRCEKKIPCIIEDGTTSCASTTCVVNQHEGCSCRYPPAFKQFSCTGNITGICNCNDEH